jgi:hypothetical protein
MAKDVIHLHGKDLVVREDTARAFRGVHWAATVVIICLAIIAIITGGLFYKASRDGNVESPAQLDNSTGR